MKYIALILPGLIAGYLHSIESSKFEPPYLPDKLENFKPAAVEIGNFKKKWQNADLRACSGGSANWTRKILRIARIP